jgi:hypothetical protein
MRRARRDLLNCLVRGVDSLLRRVRRIAVYSNDPECIYRISTGSAPRDISLPDGARIRRGEAVGILHIWPEHIPPISSSGVSLAWATAVAHASSKSLRLLSGYLTEHPELDHLVAFGNQWFFTQGRSAARALERIGFFVLQGRRGDGRLGGMKVMGGRIWTWLLRRAFNEESMRGLRLRDFQRQEIWLTRAVLLEKYGKGSCSP